MASEQLLILAIVVIVVITVAIVQVRKNRHRIKRVVLEWSEPRVPTAEEMSKAELERIQELIKDRKQIAGKTDISYHLWSLYISHFRCSSPQSMDHKNQDGKRYDLKILQVSTKNNLNKFEFELNGTKYKFVDDEEKQSWRIHMKYFSLFLYDDSDRRLIDIPIKLRVDGEGKSYSIGSDAPKAFLPGGWINEFIYASLKHQSIRNQEIRAQKHQERLWEIEDLKDRFGISD